MEKPLLLLNLFTESMQKKDDIAAGQYRQEILQLPLISEAAVIAQYRLGFFTLYQEKNIDEAMAIFKEVAACGIHCDDFFQCQITYAICLWNKGKQAHAIFELRKMLSRVTPKTIHEVLGLDYLSLFMRDTKAPQEEILKLTEQRIDSLNALLQNQSDLDTQSSLKLELAAAIEERAKPNDLEQARQILKSIVDLNTQISKPLVSAAKAALKQLNKTK